MALDEEYFDSIQLELIWKKYYSANKVNAVLNDIYQQAMALNEENETLRRKLNAALKQSKQRREECVQQEALCRQLQAELKEAEQRQAESMRQQEALCRQLQTELKKAEQRQAESMQQQEYAVQKVQAYYSRMRDQHIRSIEAINADWQDFLCGLLPEEAESLSPVPADMAEKVSAIASELLAIGSLEDK